jgi:hypothetical protein
MIMTLTPLKVGRLDEGIRGRLNGVIKVGRVKTSIGISMLEAGRRGVAGGNEKKRQRDWHLDVGGRAARGGRRQREEATM